MKEYRKSNYDMYLRLKNHFYPLYKNTKLDQIDYMFLDQFKTKKLKEGLSKNIINKNITELIASLNRAIDFDLLKGHHFKKVKKYKLADNAIVRYLSYDEEKAFREALKKHDNIFLERATNLSCLRGHKSLGITFGGICSLCF